MVAKDHKCSVCGKTFSTKQHYDRHVRTHTGEKPFNCSTCGKYFKRKDALKIHKVQHTGDQPFKRTFCHQKFLSPTRLRQHLFTHTGFPYKCPICPSEFGYPSDLKRHSLMHTGERRFECTECDMKFVSKGALVAHLKSQMKEKSFRCEFCPKTYGYKGQLKTHLRLHTGETLKCESCDFQTIYTSHLSDHLKRRHTSKSSTILTCALCSKTFNWKAALELHVRVHTGEKPYKCRFCGKSFISSDSMKTCIQKHIGEKPNESQLNPYKCKICFKFFPSQSRLKSHMFVHTAEKTFHCNQCSFKCRYKTSLEEHLVSHNGGNYKCSFCPKQFIRPGRLAEHLRFHAGEKPFKCKLCPYRSKVPVSKCHMMNHEKEERFMCRFCTLFSSGTNGRTLLHEQNYHGSAFVSIANNSESPFNTHISPDYQIEPLTCKECKFSCFNEKFLCIHNSQCHSLPLVIAKKLHVK